MLGAVARLPTHEAVRVLGTGLRAEGASVAGRARTLAGHVVTGAVTCDEGSLVTRQLSRHALGNVGGGVTNSRQRHPTGL